MMDTAENMCGGCRVWSGIKSRTDSPTQSHSGSQLFLRCG